MIRECSRHGMAHHYSPTDRSGWRCSRCAGEAVTDRRRRVKAQLVEEAGGGCVRCGYAKCIAALQFHHRDPSGKDHTIRFSNTVGIDRLRAEAAKCDLLCANCHAEVEDERRIYGASRVTGRP